MIATHSGAGLLMSKTATMYKCTGRIATGPTFAHRFHNPSLIPGFDVQWSL